MQALSAVLSFSAFNCLCLLALTTASSMAGYIEVAASPSDRKEITIHSYGALGGIFRTQLTS